MNLKPNARSLLVLESSVVCYKWLFSSCKVLNVQVDRVVSSLTLPEHLTEKEQVCQKGVHIPSEEFRA